MDTVTGAVLTWLKSLPVGLLTAAEATDIVASADGFMAKVLVTEDTVTIAVSSASLKRWVWEGAGRYRVGAPKNTKKFIA